MPNVIEACLRRVYNVIPTMILEKAFRLKSTDSLDNLIHSKIIVERVLFDCNLVAGRYKQIPLDPNWIESSVNPAPLIYGNTRSECIYRIPPHARENRNISMVLEIRHNFNQYFAGMGTDINFNTFGNTADTIATQALASQTFMYNIPLPSPVLVSGHQVKLMYATTPQMHDLPWLLICRLNYDEDFTNLNAQAILPLVELVLLATESYIYTNLVLEIDQAVITGGAEFGKFKELVESYGPAEEKYLESLKAFNGGATVLDPEGRRRRIMSMV